jgi:hypothetical protein
MIQYGGMKTTFRTSVRKNGVTFVAYTIYTAMVILVSLLSGCSPVAKAADLYSALGSDVPKNGGSSPSAPTGE